MAVPTQSLLNLGGEGEEKGTINQQPEWLTMANYWGTLGLQFAQLIGAGEPVLFCSNTDLPFPDGKVDRVFSNNVPIDQGTWLGSGVQSREVHRILRKGGEWLVNGTIVYTKP